jgi:VanZ family protein
MAGVLLAALASEVVQFWVPGRTPLWSDVRDDLVGGVVGVSLGAVSIGLLRAIRRAWISRSELGGE